MPDHVPHPEGRRIALSVPFDSRSIRWLRGTPCCRSTMTLTRDPELATRYAPDFIAMALKNARTLIADKTVTVF